MPWLNKVPNDERHICKAPSLSEGGIGSKWECDDCHAVWMISQGFMGEKRRWRFLYYEVEAVIAESMHPDTADERDELAYIPQAIQAPPYLMD